MSVLQMHFQALVCSLVSRNLQLPVGRDWVTKLLISCNFLFASVGGSTNGDHQLLPVSCHSQLAQKGRQPWEWLWLWLSTELQPKEAGAIENSLPIGHHFWLSLYIQFDPVAAGSQCTTSPYPLRQLCWQAVWFLEWHATFKNGLLLQRMLLSD